MKRTLFQRLAGSAAALLRGPAEPTPSDPAASMREGLLALGFTEQENEGRRVMLRQTGRLLVTVSNMPGTLPPSPDDWAVTVYDTEAPLWPNDPAACALIYSRANLPSSYNITLAAAEAMLRDQPKGE